MNPVEMDAQRWRQLRIEDTVLDHRHHAAGNQCAQIAFGLAQLSALLLRAGNMVDVNDHRTAVSRQCDPAAPTAAALVNSIPAWPTLSGPLHEPDLAVGAKLW